MVITPTPVPADSIHALGHTGLFAALPTEELVALAGCLRRRRYPRNAVIFVAGDPGSSLYLIESGLVKIAITSVSGKELVINLLGPGEFFGDLSLLDGEPRSADAVAKEDCQLLLLQRDDFLRYLETRPRVAAHLLASLSRRLRLNTQMLQEAAFLDIPGRIASALLQMAGSAGTSSPEGPVITTSLTQAELAGMVGATRESVNKWLRHYERSGVIRWTRGAITILRPDALRQRIV